MRIKKAVAICAAQGRLTLWDTDNGGQWITNGYAAYKLEGLPRLTIDQLCAMHDITGKKRDKLFTSQQPAPESLCFDDVDIGEEEPVMPPVRLVSESCEIQPCLLGAGLSGFNVRYMEPVDIDGEYFRLTARRTPSGGTYFAVKDGLVVQAIIMPWGFGRILSTEINRLARYASLGTPETCAIPDDCGDAEEDGDE